MNCIRKFFGIAVIIVGIATASQTWAQESDSSSAPKTGFLPTVGIGAAVLNTVLGTNTSGVIGFQGYVKGSYFFTPNVGVSLGSDFTFRGHSLASSTTSAPFLDIPFSFSFSLPWQTMGSGSRPITHLGLYYAMPLGDYSGDLDISSFGEKKAYLGLLLSHDTLFKVTENFSMGFNTWLKYGLVSAFETSDVKYFDFGIGLVLGF